VNDSIKTARPHAFLEPQSAKRDYEYTQVGDRLYYHYQINEEGETISLQNPNPNYPTDQYVFQVERPDSLHVNLKGKNRGGDQFSIVLSKVNKRYLLKEAQKIGRRNAGYKL